MFRGLIPPGLSITPRLDKTAIYGWALNAVKLRSFSKLQYPGLLSYGKYFEPQNIE
jgi:hypothetical protein